MLQVVTVTLRYLAVHCLLHPSNLVYQLVSIFLHHRNSEPVLGIDDPYEQEPVCLDLIEWQCEYLSIIKSLISNCHTASRVRRTQLPGWVDCYHVE